MWSPGGNKRLPLLHTSCLSQTLARQGESPGFQDSRGPPMVTRQAPPLELRRHPMHPCRWRAGRRRQSLGCVPPNPPPRGQGQGGGGQGLPADPVAKS